MKLERSYENVFCILCWSVFVLCPDQISIFSVSGMFLVLIIVILNLVLVSKSCCTSTKTYMCKQALVIFVVTQYVQHVMYKRIV